VNELDAGPAGLEDIAGGDLPTVDKDRSFGRPHDACEDPRKSRLSSPILSKNCVNTTGLEGYANIPKRDDVVVANSHASTFEGVCNCNEV